MGRRAGARTGCHRAETTGCIYIAAMDRVPRKTEVICRKYRVAGRVQGVFYRATAARHARELQVTGYAKNLTDGRVEVLAYGSEAALQELAKRLWIGSSASKVMSVEIVDAGAATADVPTEFLTG